MFTVQVVVLSHFITTSQYKVYLLSMFTVGIIIFDHFIVDLFLFTYLRPTF